MADDERRTFYIYCHTSPSGKRYVGQTCKTPKERWANGKGYACCTAFENAINKYGWENIRHDILCICHYKSVADEFEKYYIAKFDTTNKHKGYNLTQGGGGRLGYRLSEEQKQHLREIGKKRGISPELKQKMAEGRRRSGYRPPPMTEEQKRAASERMSGPNHPFYGKKMPREWVEKRIASVSGKKHSDEWKQHMSEGLRNSEKVKAKQRAVRKLDMDGNLVCTYEGVSEAARDVGVSKNAISMSCRGICNSAAGFRWEYVDEELRSKGKELKAERSAKETIGLPVIQYDLDGNELARFGSTVVASRETGYPRWDIAACCRGSRRTSHGYVWRYQIEHDLSAAS